MCIKHAGLLQSSATQVQFSLFSKPGINHFQELALVLIAKDLHHRSRAEQGLQKLS